jgi:hypothetical protein
MHNISHSAWISFLSLEQAVDLRAHVGRSDRVSRRRREIDQRRSSHCRMRKWVLAGLLEKLKRYVLRWSNAKCFECFRALGRIIG